MLTLLTGNIFEICSLQLRGFR